MLVLPKNWVFIHTTAGEKKNVANQNNLTGTEAIWFREHWKDDQRKIWKVTLETDAEGNGEVLRAFTF